MIIMHSIPLPEGSTVEVRDVLEGGTQQREAFAFVTYGDPAAGQVANGIAFWDPQKDGTHRLQIAARDCVTLPKRIQA